MRRSGFRAGQRGAGLAAAAVAGLGLLVGCSAETQQAATELPSASSTSAESTPELPPLGPADMPMPQDARSPDGAGAEAFLRYYMSLYNHAQQTMDSTHLRSLSRNCATCERIADDLDADAAAGYSYDGGEVQVGAVSEPRVEASQAELVFAIRQNALTVVEDGLPVDGLTFPPNASTTDGALLAWDTSRGTWVITQWDAA